MEVWIGILSKAAQCLSECVGWDKLEEEDFNRDRIMTAECYA